jgi:hypothetical protein
VLPVSLVIEHGRRYLRGCSFVMVSTKLECKAAIVKKTADALAGALKDAYIQYKHLQGERFIL